MIADDPWTHYVSTGKDAGFKWDCGICNDTCPGVFASNVWLFDNQVIFLIGFLNAMLIV